MAVTFRGRGVRGWARSRVAVTFEDGVYFVAEVWAVEGCVEALGLFDPEHLLHVRLHPRAGRRRQGHGRRVRELLLEAPECHIVGAEVVTPR